MTDLKRVHMLITGRVQGVYYRASTEQQAQKLGLTGWVRNLPNGCVELEAQGTQQQLDALEAWAKQGPAQANVTSVKTSARDCEQKEPSFVVKY